MDSVLRALAIYIFILVAFRLSGKRTLADVSTFDFILLLIIGEATQQALLGEDFSITNAVTVITTFLVVEIALSYFAKKFKKLDKWVNGLPVVILENGKIIKERASKERIEESDILEAARRLQGIERLEQIKYAILERSGGITVIPYKKT